MDIDLNRGNSLTEYKAFVAEWFRSLESKRAGNDDDKLRDLAQSTDNEILRRWLWRVSIISAPIAFVVLPMVVFMIQRLVWPALLSVIWLAVKTIMGTVFLIFLLAVYLTFFNRESQG